MASAHKNLECARMCPNVPECATNVPPNVPSHTKFAFRLSQTTDLGTAKRHAGSSTCNTRSAFRPMKNEVLHRFRERVHLGPRCQFCVMSRCCRMCHTIPKLAFRLSQTINLGTAKRHTGSPTCNTRRAFRPTKNKVLHRVRERLCLGPRCQFCVLLL